MPAPKKAVAARPMQPAEALAVINVDHVLPEVENMLEVWGTVRDCIDGQKKVKDKGILYLPMPNAADQSTENHRKYAAFKARGVYVNFTARTLNGMVGTAFSKEPVLTVPAALDVMHDNVDGGAVSIDQQAKQVLSDALSVGRCGLFTDYPTVDGIVPQAAVNNGEVRPVIQYYFAENILNWRYTVHMSLRKLSLVVLMEQYDIVDDGFKREQADQYRVLRLEDGENGDKVYTQEVYKVTKSGLQSEGKITPKMKGGKPFNYIPFEFVGSRNNDGGIDEVPMIGIADLNLAHYRNFCDFEQMVHVLGQPTTVIAGLTTTWVTEVLNGKVEVGSTVALMLPEGATATYLQVAESQLALEAMKHKEDLIVAIGGKMVHTASVQKTAKEASMDDASDQSVLMSAVTNVNAAYKRCLRTCAEYMGAPVTEDTGYELNTDFEIMQLDHAALAARVKMWVDGVVTWTEVRSVLRRAGIATLEDAKAQAELDAESAKNQAAMGMEPAGVDEAGNIIPAKPPREEEEEEEAE